MKKAIDMFGWTAWLTGPIFDKELRVTSRRARYFAMRFNYVVLLSVFIYMVWVSTVEVQSGGAGVFGVSRMAEAGAAITATIVWFQFIALPLLAAVMLSTSISEEVTCRTLGVLMTTPINSFQIVMGKLLSKLLQLLILLGISLPLLAVVRVFGGIAWEYVLAGLSITLTTMLLAASVSLFFSIYHRKSQIVVSRVLGAAGLVYGLLPLLVELLDDYAISEVFARIVVAVNPFWLMIEYTETAMSPGGAVPGVPWFWHCLISVGITLAFILLATRVVRRVGRRQITGQEDAFPRNLKKGDRPPTTTSSAPSAAIRTVKGHPVIWKERCIPILRGNRFKVLFMPFLTIVSLLFAYGYCFYRRAMDEQETQIGFVLLFLLLVLMRNGVRAASSPQVPNSIIPPKTIGLINGSTPSSPVQNARHIGIQTIRVVAMVSASALEDFLRVALSITPMVPKKRDPPSARRAIIMTASG